MNARSTTLRGVAPALAATTLLASAVSAQLSIPWFTVDGGGGTSSGGGLTLTGTVGQADAGAMSGGGLTIAGGFWAGTAAAATCYPNCDNSTIPPILNVADFSCFLNRYAAGDTYANCDHSTVPPVLNVADFTCFLNSFAVGCGTNC